MNEPLVSVIIPTYNRANLVCQAIISAFNQTYKSKEIIVVDDGSADDTKEILSQYGDKIKYIYKINGGVSSARNAGIKEAKGEYIAFLDSDDAWRPEKLELQIGFLRQNSHIDAVISDVEFIDDKGVVLRKTCLRSIIPEDGDILPYLISHFQAMHTILLKKSVFEDVGYFDISLTTAEDIDMLLRIANNYKIGLISVSEPLTRVNIDQARPFSLSKALFTGNRLKALQKLKDYAPDAYRSYGGLIRQAILRINLGYAEDLLWHRYYSKARAQALESMKSQISMKSIFLYFKSIIMQMMSAINENYKDKGKIDA